MFKSSNLVFECSDDQYCLTTSLNCSFIANLIICKSPSDSQFTFAKSSPPSPSESSPSNNYCLSVSSFSTSTTSIMGLSDDKCISAIYLIESSVYYFLFVTMTLTFGDFLNKRLKCHLNCGTFYSTQSILSKMNSIISSELLTC